MIVLRGGTVVDPESSVAGEKDLYIKGDKIVDIRERQTLPIEGEIEVIDVSGLHILPGFVDLHCHLREPGFEWKEDIESGTRAAVAGGFTSVVCMANTDPVNDNPETTRYIIEKARKSGFARVYPVASVTRKMRGEELTDFGELLEAGVVAFSDDGKPIMNPRVMIRALDYGKMFGATLILHEEDDCLSEGGAVNEGDISTELGLPSIPSVSEDIMIGRDISLAEYTGGKIHIAHLSTRGGVDLIRDAKKRGVDISAETAPHYFTLTERAVYGYNTRAKMNPPLRSEEDRQAIIEGIKDGTIDCIATDHAPHEYLVKECEFQEAAFGIIGLQTAFPLLLELVGDLDLDINVLVKLLAYNPSNILNIKGGFIGVNGRADLAVADLANRYTFTEQMIFSKSKNSPFIGRELTGKVIMTFVGGKIVYQEGQGRSV